LHPGEALSNLARLVALERADQVPLDSGEVRRRIHLGDRFLDVVLAERALPERVRFGWSVIQKRADVGIDHLADVLRATARGESVIDTQVVKAREESVISPIEQLSLRQRQIIALAASGVDANIIAEELGLAPVTIRQELSRIYAVLVPDPKRGTDLRTTAVLRYLRETRRYEQAGGE